MAEVRCAARRNRCVERGVWEGNRYERIPELDEQHRGTE
jgi:hypothetical protein